MPSPFSLLFMLSPFLNLFFHLVKGACGTNVLIRTNVHEVTNAAISPIYRKTQPLSPLTNVKCTWQKYSSVSLGTRWAEMNEATLEVGWLKVNERGEEKLRTPVKRQKKSIVTNLLMLIVSLYRPLFFFMPFKLVQIKLMTTEDTRMYVNK